MDGSGHDLALIQQELQAVKQALRKGAVHLGLQGENLQRYLLQLNEKENLLLSRQLRHMNADALEPLQPPLPTPPPAAVPMTVVASRAPTAPSSVAKAGEAAGAVPPEAQGSLPPASRSDDGAVQGIKPTPPPAGHVASFNRENLDSVLSHLQSYEAVAAECTKALRALSSLAYADAHAVGNNTGVLEQVMRVLAIHSGEPAVGVVAMRALCNMAYNHSVALTRLTESSVMAAFLDAMTQNSELGGKASEAVARIVAASQAGPNDAEARRNGTSPSASGEPPGGLVALFLAASTGKATWQQVVPRLVAQLVVNEVVEVVPVAKAFFEAGRQCSPAGTVGWLSLAKQLTVPDCPCLELPQPLVNAGTISAAAELMGRSVDNGMAQLAGIEALSSLVGSRWSGLVAFAEVGGMLRIETAMREHVDHEILQTKGMRALASGIQWPQEIQDKAQYSHIRSVHLTKAAMAKHGGNAELQAAALEALTKYLEKTRCVEEVKEQGGAGLVKAVMARHSSEPKVLTWGRNVLGAIGDDRQWMPRGLPEHAER